MRYFSPVCLLGQNIFLCLSWFLWCLLMEVSRNVTQTLQKLWKCLHCAEDATYQKTNDTSGASDQRQLMFFWTGVLILRVN